MIPAVKIDASALGRLANGIELSQKQQGLAVVRALNRTGDTAYARVARVLSQETGMPVARVRRVMSRSRAHPLNPGYVITATDKYTSLKDFNPRQVRRGVSAAPWRKRRIFRGTFFGTGGHVYRRVGAARLPIKRLFGPAIPQEVVRGASKAEADKAMAERFLPELAHEIAYRLGKIKT